MPKARGVTLKWSKILKITSVEYNYYNIIFMSK